MSIPNISPSELAATAYAKAAEVVDTATKQIVEKTAELEALKSAGASASEISALSNSISTLSTGLNTAKALQELERKKVNFALLQDIEMTDVNVTLPTLTVADILGMLPPLPTPPEFPPKLSLSVKTLLNPSVGFGDPPGVPAIPSPILRLLKLPPKLGNIGGPGGSFTVGANITQNIITTDTVIAPAVNVTEMLTAPTIVAGNIASTTTLNLAATTSITLTAPTVVATTPTLTVTGSLVSAQVSSGAGVFVTLTSASKFFDIPHPTKPGMRLRHGCLEGPELAVYVRGKTKEQTIALPDYWNGLVDQNSITVQLTPTSSDQCLHVTKTSLTSVEVSGDLSLPYYYMIMAERIDVEKLQPEYEDPNGNI
jgi:hypothetical protein